MRKILLDCFEGIPLDRLLPMAKEAGFDGIYTSWRVIDDLETMRQLRHLADKLGLEYENAHATIPGTGFLWSPIPEGDACAETLLGNLKNCAAVGVPMTVVHVAPRADADFALGICRMARIVEAAEKLGVQVAFENCHDASFLIRTLEYFAGADCVGFCYDSGHEAFLTPGVRLLPQIGDRLICTHLNDNYLDGDHHLIPGDGKIDFRMIGQELKACGYRGNVTLELNYNRYLDTLTPEAFLEKSSHIAGRIREYLDQ
jgi:sugar phosphate isomerase/epimerase